MELINVTLTLGAAEVIDGLRHSCGTSAYYRAALDRMFTCVLRHSDELGMSDYETLDTLRAIDALRSDLAELAVATPSAQTSADAEDSSERNDLESSPETVSETVLPHSMS